jgi:ADP-heptose:LPS heptosyltransferase
MDVPFAVLVPGAGHPTRQWPAESFAEVARALIEVHRLAVVLVGTPQEDTLGQLITEICPTVMDRIGQTHTDTLVELIAQSEMVITNETAAVHIAGALGQRVICISNGSRYGRFHPYPPMAESRIHFLYPPAMQAKNSNYTALVRKYSERSHLDISTITPEIVLKAFTEMYHV